MRPVNDKCWCGAPALPKRATCCDEHARKSMGKRKRRKDRRCQCGALALPRRATCSDDCRDRYAPKLKQRSCDFCGGSFIGNAKGRRYCSDICRDSAVKSRVKVHACSVCGKPRDKLRKTCSDECLGKLREQHADAQARYSPATRRRRSADKKKAYNKADKAEVTARLAAEQGGLCLVCGSEGHERGDGKLALVLDHCHVTGRPRAALCGRCNAALGFMLEDPRSIERLAVYAEVCLAERNVMLAVTTQ